MAMLNRILLAAGMSWRFSGTLGLLFAACASGRFSLRTLLLPGVVPVALIISTVLAVVKTEYLVGMPMGKSGEVCNSPDRGQNSPTIQ